MRAPTHPKYRGYFVHTDVKINFTSNHRVDSYLFCHKLRRMHVI